MGIVSTYGLLVLLLKKRIDSKTIAQNSKNKLILIINYEAARKEKVSSSLKVRLLVDFGNQEFGRYRQ
jgi:hypothetical protein